MKKEKKNKISKKHSMEKNQEIVENNFEISNSLWNGRW